MSSSGSRRYPPYPLLGVGALIFREDRVLLVQRGKQPLQGWWSLPGGLVETGERLADAVKREVMEETCLDVRPLEVFEIFERIMPDADGKAEYHYVLIDYICDAPSGDAKADTDVAAVEWVKQSELCGYQLTEGTLPVIERAFAHIQAGK